jgi:hypothetical protein
MFRSVAAALKVIYGEVTVCVRRMSGETPMRGRGAGREGLAPARGGTWNAQTVQGVSQ